MSERIHLELDVTSSADLARVSVTITGPVGHFNAKAISAVVTMVSGWTETRRVVVDLRRARLVDLGGISALVTCQRELHAVGMGFEVVGAGEPLKVLELTGLLGICDRQAGRPVPACGSRTMDA